MLDLGMHCTPLLGYLQLRNRYIMKKDKFKTSMKNTPDNIDYYHSLIFGEVGVKKQKSAKKN